MATATKPMKMTTVEAFTQGVDDAIGEGGAVAIAAVDLDHFDELNTTFGRDAADGVLCSWERTLRGSLPGEATVARVGGDEYVVALPDHSAESALILLEEIRSHWSGRYPTDEVTRRIDVSVGIASRPPHATKTMELLQAAQSALQRSKREGRARASIYVEEKMVLKSNYYARAALDRLARLSANTGRTEASLLREALEDVLEKHRDQT